MKPFVDVSYLVDVRHYFGDVVQNGLRIDLFKLLSYDFLFGSVVFGYAIYKGVVRDGNLHKCLQILLGVGAALMFLIRASERATNSAAAMKSSA